MYNKQLPTCRQIGMDQMETTMRQWRMSRVKTITPTITAAAVAVQDRELLAVTYEKKATKPEREVLTAGERRYCTQTVLTSSRPRVSADLNSV
jgi:hypothetical protein